MTSKTERAGARTWVEITIDAPEAWEELVSSRLLDLGAPGLVETGRHEGRVSIAGHFDPDEADLVEAAALRFVEALGEEEDGSGTVSRREIHEEDWAENWKAGFPARAVGENLWVHPPWEPAVPPGRVGIEIEPAMAFGTGTHETTRGCLEILDGLPLEGRRVLDLGTGSAILAIAAARLGAGRVLAIDDDPVATEAARKNVETNGVGDVVAVETGTLADDGEVYDVVLANIFANVVIELMPLLTAKVAPGGVLVLSGFLDDDAASVADAARRRGFVGRERRREKRWNAIRFEREGE